MYEKVEEHSKKLQIQKVDFENKSRKQKSKCTNQLNQVKNNIKTRMMNLNWTPNAWYDANGAYYDRKALTERPLISSDESWYNLTLPFEAAETNIRDYQYTDTFLRAGQRKGQLWGTRETKLEVQAHC